MGDINLKSISDTAVDRLIAAHDGDVALLYLWLLREGTYNAENAARALCLTLRDVGEAYEKLCRMELFSPRAESAENKLMPAEEIPEYSAEYVTKRAHTDPGFMAVLSEAERKFGRALSTADVKALFGIYDYLGLPPDVIFMLLTYCVSLFAEKYGRLPSMRSIEKEAYSWAKKEILTLQQAEEFIKSAAERRSEAGRVKAVLGISGRQLTPTETKYIDSWLELGYDSESLAVAFDRTVMNTGSLKWNYMNKIVLSWHEKGLHSIKDIEEKDGHRMPSAVKTEPRKSSASDDDIGRLRSIYEKVKNG